MTAGVRVRVSGADGDCQQLLDALRTAVAVDQVDGPYINRRDPGVRYYAVVRSDRATEPGS